MPVSFQTTGLVSAQPEEMAELIAGTLERLGYQNIRYIKLRAEFTAIDRNKEQIYTDTWSVHFRLRLSWKPRTGGSLVSVHIEEKDGIGTRGECQKRADEIIIALQDDYKQAMEVREWQKQSTMYGSATWAEQEELLEKGMLVPFIDSKRLLLTPYGKDFYLQLPERLTYQHAIVCGRTGVGKSTGFLIPNLVRRTELSMLVTEATPGDNDTPELYQLTAGYREKAGNHIYYFNPSDRVNSMRINPIDLVRMASSDRKADAAAKLAALIITNGTSENARIDPTWDQSEQLLLTALILYAATADESFGHIGFIRWMLLSGIKNVLGMLLNTKSDLAKEEFKGWLNNTSENFRFGVISGLLTKLNPWVSDTVVALTSSTDIDLEQIHRQRFTFYLAVPSTRKGMQTVGALVLNFLLDLLLDQELEQPLALLLDEFTNFGYIPGVTERMSLVRKRNISLVLGFQNYMQLEKVYGYKNALIIMDQASTQIYFRQKSLDEATRLSKAIGRTTVEQRTTHYDGRIHEQVIGRDLITPDELTRLPEDTVIILTSNANPIKTKKFEPASHTFAYEHKPTKRAPWTVSETTRVRNKMALEDEMRMEQEAPEDQPPKSQPVEPLNSNLSSKESEKMDKIRENRSKPPEERETDSPDFFDIWDL